MPEYTHTLIPSRVDFVPEPQQVGAFLSSLASIGAAPLRPAIMVSKPSGKVRSYRNPFTGMDESMALRTTSKLKDLAAVPRKLQALDDYDVTLSGKGPPKLPAFKFNFHGTYDFDVACRLRAEVVSTSDWHDEIPIRRKVEFFERPCNPKDRLGIFHHPSTLKVIEVPKAGCARFWIEFEFGKMLFPRIKDRLDILEPEIVAAAQRDFAIKFVQGCHWCA